MKEREKDNLGFIDNLSMNANEFQTIFRHSIKTKNARAEL